MDKFQEMISSSTPTLVDFFATWCGPCKAMHPVLEQLKSRMGDKAKIIKIDVDAPANRTLSSHYQIRNIPTLMLFRDGEVVWKNIGATDLDTLVGAIENV